MSYPVATKLGSHITSALLAGAFATAQFRHYNAWEGDLSGISPDELFVTMALPFAVFAAIFGAGHMLIRKLDKSARVTYPLLGVLGLIAASLAVMPMTLIETAIEKGIVSIFVVLTSAVGALIGYLHFRSAGYEYDEDEIEQLEEVMPAAAPAMSLKTTQPQSVEQSDEEPAETQNQAQAQAQANQPSSEKPALIKTQGGSFFDGPLQVITSGNAVFAAALVGAFVHFLYTALFHLGFSNGKFDASENLKESILSGDFFSGIVFGLLFSVIVCGIMLPPAIYMLHKFLASKNKADLKTYVLAGGALPLGTGILMFGFGLILTHWLILPLAAAMGAYHHLAGIEPASLPGDIEVSDPRTLVGEDHVRRRMRRVVG